jgi:cellulose synthase/poly-beta-1,6-N-acetylglucosamine synthase-like glycosyltransferase
VLASWLIAGLVCAALSTLLLLLPVPVLIDNAIGAWAWSRRLVLALIGTAAVLVVGIGVLEAVGATRANLLWSAVAVALASALWLPATRRWSARAHLCWACTVFLFIAYLAFMIDWTFQSGLSALSEVGGLALWLLEVLAAILACAYLWELCDALGSQHWRRRVGAGARTDIIHAGPLPFVSLHVPAHNEPPEMVIETLSALCSLDYPSYEVVAIDDNTDDPDMWRPVETWCRLHGVKFQHLEDWPGYKSGALNFALHHLTDPQAELIGVCDADYQMSPDFLLRCAPLFRDDRVGFIQAPQDYREWERDRFYRRLYYSYEYFFAVSQPSRNERNGAIFAGTMGLIRRKALDELGGWNEWCITEDAELSLRLLRAGWSGLHVDRSFGNGIMPLTFEALKGQRFRWCFGGIQILRMHWRSLLFERSSADNHMSTGQRWAYLSGALQWYGDLLGLLFFLFLLAGAANVGAGGGLLFRKLTGFLIATIPLLFALGLLRAIALLRRRTGASWREALGAFLIWQSTSLVTARASVQGLFAREAEFLRTPKTSDRSTLWDAVKSNRGETLLALAGVAAIGSALTRPHTYAGPLTAVLLLWPTVSYATALVNSRAAQRAALPPALAARRRTEWLRATPQGRVTVAFGAVGASVLIVLVVVGLLAPQRGPVHTPSLLSPAKGASSPSHPPSAPASNSPSRSASPTPTSSTRSASSPPSTTSPTTTPTTTPTPTTSQTPTPTSTPSPTSSATTSPSAATSGSPASAPPPSG